MSAPQKGGSPGGAARGAPGALDLDAVLLEAGPLGRYQRLALALAALPIVFSAFQASEYIFTTARIPTRCLVPQCDGPTPAFWPAPAWLAHALPAGAGGQAFDNCHQFGNSSTPPPPPAEPGTCPRELFDPDTIVPCQQYVYENTHSVVYDFGLACSEWRRAQLGAMRTLGSLLVLPLTGYVSDRWGRRAALGANALNTAWLGLARASVSSYRWFSALSLLESTLGAGIYSSCFILVTELVGAEYRVLAGVIISSYFALGQMALGLIAWAVPSWKPLTLVLYAPQLVVIAYFWILSESVRWLMSKGRYEESELVLKKVAKVNRKELSQESLAALRASVEAEKHAVRPKEPWLVVLVFQSRTLLRCCVVAPVWWVASTLIYYGMGVNAVNMVGNGYVNYVAAAAAELPGYWASVLLLDRVGRKPVLLAGFWLCALCQFAFAFMPEGLPGLALCLYLFAKCCISMVSSALYTYTAELFPTRHRHSLFAFSSMIGRLGSIVAPLTPALAHEVWQPLPAVMFGSMALLAGLLTLATPETRGRALPDTVEQAECGASAR